MDPGSSLPCSQEPNTRLCPQLDESSTHPHILLYMLSSYLRLDLPYEILSLMRVAFHTPGQNAYIVKYY
jgi:hypothetical protein